MIIDFIIVYDGKRGWMSNYELSMGIYRSVYDQVI
jgi:hypothetical protein